MMIVQIAACTAKVESAHSWPVPEETGASDSESESLHPETEESEMTESEEPWTCPRKIAACAHTAPCPNVGTVEAEDATACCIIEGDLEIKGERLLETRFTILQCLQEVTGSVVIDGVKIDALGFENLTRVGEELRIERVEIKHLQMPALTAVDTLVVDSETVRDLTGLERLESVSHTTIMAPNITSLTGIEPALESSATVFLGYLDNTTDYSALLRLPTKLEQLSIWYGSTPDIPTLPVEDLGALVLWYTGARELEFASNVRSISGGGISLWGNAGLLSLAGLRYAQGAMETLLILDNPLLTSLDGLQGVTTVSENIDIWGNPNLESVRLDGLTQVGGRIWVSEVDNATEVYMPALAEVEGYFMWIGPDQLTDMTGLDALRRVGGTFWLSTDATSLVGLGTLEYAQHFLLEDTSAIRDLTGLDSLVVVDGAGFTLLKNRALESTRGADALETARRLTLIDNPRLAELSFPSLTDVAFVHIEGNRSLPTCQIDRLQEQLAAYGSFPDFDVANNGTDDPTACD